MGEEKEAVPAEENVINDVKDVHSTEPKAQTKTEENVQNEEHEAKESESKVETEEVEVKAPEAEKKEQREQKEEKSEEKQKPKHFANGSITDWIWKHGDLNPDYRLAVLNAANEGFQSKMNADVGSYVIHGFWRRATALIKEKGEVSRLGKIFKEIQYDLGEWKQFPVFNWNND